MEVSNASENIHKVEWSGSDEKRELGKGGDGKGQGIKKG